MFTKGDSTKKTAYNGSSPFYGFDHAAVNRRFRGGLTFVAEVTLGDELPWAVYRCADPDVLSGHKEILLLRPEERDGKRVVIVAGMDLDAFAERWARHPALKCLACQSVLYSHERHSVASCSCLNEAFIDGGRDYVRCGALSPDMTAAGTVNLLTRRFYPSSSYDVRAKDARPPPEKIQ